MRFYAGIERRCTQVAAGARWHVGTDALPKQGGVRWSLRPPSRYYSSNIPIFLTFVRYFNLARCRLLLRKDLWTWLSCSPALAVLGLG